MCKKRNNNVQTTAQKKQLVYIYIYIYAYVGYTTISIQLTKQRKKRSQWVKN